MLPLKSVVADEALQMREGGIDWDFVDTLADALRKAHLSPITVFADEKDADTYWLADGFHRRAAYESEKRPEIPATVHPGGRDAAFQCCLGANADQNAKPRTRKDLRKAVIAALREFYFAQTSEAENTKFVKLPRATRLSFERIAEICRTTQQTVSNVAAALQREASGAATEPEERRGPSGAPEQLDFWEELRSDYLLPIASARAMRSQPAFLRTIQSDPKRAVDEIESIVNGLNEEVRELRQLAQSVKTGAAL